MFSVGLRGSVLGAEDTTIPTPVPALTKLSLWEEKTYTSTPEICTSPLLKLKNPRHHKKNSFPSITTEDYPGNQTHYPSDREDSPQYNTKHEMSRKTIQYFLMCCYLS